MPCLRKNSSDTFNQKQEAVQFFSQYDRMTPQSCSSLILAINYWGSFTKLLDSSHKSSVLLLYGCTTWTLTKRLEKKLDGNYTRAILNKSWRQHATRHLPPTTKTIKVRRSRHAGYCWRSRDELISDVLLWTPHMAEQKQDDQLEYTYSSYVRIGDLALKTCQRRWTIGRSGERGSGISVQVARHDDDDDKTCSEQLMNWGRTHMCFFSYGLQQSDLLVLTNQKDLHISALCGHWTHSKVPARNKGRQGRSARMSPKGFRSVDIKVMILIYIYIYI